MAEYRQKMTCTGHSLAALSIFLMTVVYGNECPHQCQCDDAVYVVDCSYFPGPTSSLFKSINDVTFTTWFHLSLCQNGIMLLSESDLSVQTLWFLRTLDLSFNKLNSTSLGDLRLERTTVLDLSFNAFTEVPLKFLKTLINLESLSMSHNAVSNIRAFTNVSRTLKHLDLSHNNLTLLRQESFLGLEKLVELDISHNRVSALPSGVLDHLPNLVSLNASFNQIRFIEVGVFTTVMSVLHSVDLSHNNLLEFEPWPYLPENLVNFNLSYNTITKFCNHLKWEQDLSINVPELSRHNVDLRNNNFTRWIGDDLGRYHKNGNYTVYDFVHYGFDLSQNPWYCDCHFYKFVKEVQESFVGFYIPRLTCASPSHLKDANVLSLNPDVFVCNITVKCPERCQCQFRPSEGVTYVDCVVQNLKRLPSELPDPSVHLDFSRNIVTELNWTPSMQKIIYLNLTHNLLTKIDASVFKNMPNLKTIDLSFNDLHVLPESIQLLPSESVRLTGNVLLCSCDEIWLPNWLRLGNSSSGNSLLCLPSVHIEQDTRVRDVTASRLQCHRDIAIIISCTLSILLFLFVTASVVMVKFSYELKVIVYRLLKYHPRDTLPSDTDATKLYDVYISCDDDDPKVMKIVKDVFLPNLEEDDPRYDIFVPIRQMALGDCKADAIVEGISQSRRVVALVTHGYLATGGWCLYEFDQAHKLLVEDGSGKCIVVLLADLGETDLQEEPLRSYITQKQFFKMTDKLFWTKLRYELPVK